MAYLTLQEFRQHRDIKNAGDDVVIAAYIQAAQQMIDDYCGRTFEALADTTRYYDPVRDVVRGELFIDEMSAITSVVNGDGVTVDPSEYTTEPRNEKPYWMIKILQSSGKAWEPKANGDTENAIAITGRFAYSTTANATIKHACRELTAWLYQKRDDPAFDVTVIPDQGIITSPQGWPVSVRMMLKPYRALC